MAAATRNGTTFSAEAEHCLRRGLERGSQTQETVRLLFHECVAGLMLLTARAMEQAGSSRARQAAQKSGREPRPWLADPDGFDAAIGAAVRVLQEFAPEGERVIPADDPHALGEERYVIGEVFKVVMAALRGSYPLGEREWIDLRSHLPWRPDLPIEMAERTTAPGCRSQRRA